MARAPKAQAAETVNTQETAPEKAVKATAKAKIFSLGIRGRGEETSVKYAVQTDTTTLRKIKQLVSSYTHLMKAKRSEVEIGLPDGRKITVKDLDNPQHFARLIMGSLHLSTSETSEQQMAEIHAKVAESYAEKISFSEVGQSDIRKIAGFLGKSGIDVKKYLGNK